MRNITLTLLIVFLILSCSKNEKEIDGDLYFPLIDIGTYYGKTDDFIKSFEASLDSIRFSKIAGEKELETIRFFDILKANDLLKSPCINLKTDSDIKKIYLSEQEYEKLKKYDRNKLITDNQKVELKIKTTELDSGIYYSDKISEIKLTNGKTYWRK